MSKITVIYHGNCTDGFTAAWIFRMAHGKDNTDIEYHAGVYNQPPPPVDNRTVYLLDFSYRLPVMQDIIARAEKVVIIDHHISAIKELDCIDDPKFVKFFSRDNSASGAMLTWQYFFPDVPAPRFVQHIDDRDRWKFNMPGTREVQANAFSYDYTFENWDFLASQDIDDQIKDGTAIERKHHKDVKELMGEVVRRMIIAGYNVPVANIPRWYGSDMCSLLAKNEPFSGYYYDLPDRRVFGLRSEVGAVDVSEIARRFGGGGHATASGFSVTYKQAEEFEIK